MIKPERIAQVLGGEKVLRRRVRSLADLEAAVAVGLPKATLSHSVHYAVADRAQARRVMEQIVPPATYKRRKKALKFAESERVERLARVIATAEEVFADHREASTFLLARHPLLDGRRPLDLALSELGARRVEELLWQLALGLPA